MRVRALLFLFVVAVAVTTAACAPDRPPGEEMPPVPAGPPDAPSAGGTPVMSTDTVDTIR